MHFFLLKKLLPFLKWDIELLLRCLRTIFGWVRFLVVRFLYKTNPNPRKIICCGKKVTQKSGPNASFNLFCLGLGWPWVGEFVGFMIIFICFPTEQNFACRKHPNSSCEEGAKTILPAVHSWEYPGNGGKRRGRVENRLRYRSLDAWYRSLSVRLGSGLTGVPESYNASRSPTRPQHDTRSKTSRTYNPWDKTHYTPWANFRSRCYPKHLGVAFETCRREVSMVSSLGGYTLHYPLCWDTQLFIFIMMLTEYFH